MESADQRWKGYNELDTLFVFGDSFSSVMPLVTTHFLPQPTNELPLGVPFPGTAYTDGDTPNWVGFVVETWTLEQPLRVYDFAIGGHTVHDMYSMVHGPYHALVESVCQLGKQWSAQTALFVFWIGINDVSDTWEEDEIQRSISSLFESVQTVYDTGARVFLFIDVPPVGRILDVTGNLSTSERFDSICSVWNSQLNEAVRCFADKYPDARCLEYSSHSCLSDILDNPVKHGFTEADVTKEGGQIWVDHIHITGAVHHILGKQIVEYLKSV